MSLPQDSSDISDAFFPLWIKTFQGMGVDPMFPLKAVMHESGLFAGAHNPNGNAVGLIQFMPETLKFLGFPGTWRDMQRLRAEEQIPWIAKYYRPYAASIKSPALAYVATFLPGMTAKAAAHGPDFHLTEDPKHGGLLSWAYIANPGFDVQKKGWIEVQDLDNMIAASAKGARWDSIEKRMLAAMNAPAPSPAPAPSATPPAPPAPAIAGENNVLANVAPKVQGHMGLILGLAVGAAAVGAAAWYIKNKPARERDLQGRFV
jgi:hypothetical protein